MQDTATSDAPTIENVLDIDYPNAPSWAADGAFLAATVYEDDGPSLRIVAGDEPTGDAWHPCPDRHVARYAWAPEPTPARLAAVTDDGTLLLVNADRRTVEPLSDGVGTDDLAWTTDAGRLAIYRDDRPTVVALDGATETTRAPERGGFLGEERMLAWGPDDRLLATRFVDRDAKQVAVVDTDADEIVWRSRAADRSTSDPAWLGDGRLLLDRLGDDGAVREFVAVDPSDGTTRRLFREEDTEHGVVSRGRPVVSPDGSRIVAPLPLDGWDHVHAFDAATGERTQLTAGAFEDKGLASATPRWLDDETLVVASNRRDDGRRDLFAVRLDGSVRPLVVREGTDVHPRPAPDGSRLAFVHCDAGVSPEIRVVDLPDSVWNDSDSAEADDETSDQDGTASEDGDTTTENGARTSGAATNERRVTTSAVREWPIEPIAPERVTYESTGGREITGYLLDPRESERVADDATDLPAVVWVHGGPMRQMRDGWHPSRSYGLAYAVHQRLAHEGYVGLFVNYRGGIGYGREFRQALTGVRGRAEMDDVANGAAVLRELPHTSGAVGVWGLSYGGYATLQLLGTHPDAFDVGVNLAGLADLEAYRDWAEETKYPGVASAMTRRLGGEPWESDEWAAASPVTHAADYQAPLYNFHGTGDRYVDVEQLDIVVDAVLEHGLDADWEYYPDENHVFSARTTWERALRRIERAFADHLR